MKKLADILVVTLGVGIVALFLSFVTSGPVGAQNGQSNNVVVTNSSSRPVPVISEDNSARNPVSLRATGSEPGCSDCTVSDMPLFFGLASSPSTRYFVPAGQRLVIEDVSVYAELPAGQRVLVCSIEVTSVTGETRGSLAPPFIATKNNSIDVFNFSQLYRAYFDPGAGVFMTCERNGITGTASYDAEMQGYLVAVP